MERLIHRDNPNTEAARYPLVGDHVTLADEDDCIIPAGTYRVSRVNPDGSFHVGGNTSVWPRRIAE